MVIISCVLFPANVTMSIFYAIYGKKYNVV